MTARATKEDLLSELFLDYTECKNCNLHGIATQKVYGYGNPNSRILFLGIGPGEDEDIEGTPFVGASGQLLQEYLIRVGLAEYDEDNQKVVYGPDVYLTNVVLCRPANIVGKKVQNRDPTREEVEACGDRLAKEIYIIDPLIIITLGEVAYRTLSKKQKLGNDRGQIMTVTLKGKGESVIYPVIPTWHPSRLLRNPSLKEGDPRSNVLTDLTKAVRLLNEYSDKIKLLETISR